MSSVALVSTLKSDILRKVSRVSFIRVLSVLTLYTCVVRTTYMENGFASPSPS